MRIFDKKIRTRRILIRSGLVIVWIGLACILFIIYRGHTLLVDNRNLEGGTRAPDLITVSVNGGRGLEFFRGDRDRFSVTGSKHRVRVEFSDGRAPFEAAFELPLKDDMYILSIPNMIENIEPFVEVFHTAPEPRQDEEEAAGDDEFGASFEAVP